jgi:hypothetical protein
VGAAHFCLKQLQARSILAQQVGGANCAASVDSASLLVDVAWKAILVGQILLVRARGCLDEFIGPLPDDPVSMAGGETSAQVVPLVFVIIHRLMQHILRRQCP